MGDLTANFSYREFRCRCGCGLEMVSPVFVTRLQTARTLLGRGIAVTSGVRCVAHNAAVGGEPNSSHVRGLAADLTCATSTWRLDLLMAVIAAGFNRIGIGENFLHVDIDRTLPQDVCWTYPAGKSRW